MVKIHLIINKRNMWFGLQKSMFKEKALHRLTKETNFIKVKMN